MSDAYPLTYYAPNLLKHADVCELATLVAPRPLIVVDPIAPDGRPAAAEPAERAFSFTKAVYERLGAPEALRVVARG